MRLLLLVQAARGIALPCLAAGRNRTSAQVLGPFPTALWSAPTTRCVGPSPGSRTGGCRRPDMHQAG